MPGVCIEVNIVARTISANTSIIASNVKRIPTYGFAYLSEVSRSGIACGNVLGIRGRVAVDITHHSFSFKFRKRKNTVAADVLFNE
tara:strand:- start:15565 stop:15822 length:258 start_codon:yes stop_codon:yes gene_type:complete